MTTEKKDEGLLGSAGLKSYVAGAPIETTFAAKPPSENGFIKQTLYFYQRGPNDPPGNMFVWMCEVCDQVQSQGHAPNCRWSRDEAQSGEQAPAVEPSKP